MLKVVLIKYTYSNQLFHLIQKKNIYHLRYHLFDLQRNNVTVSSYNKMANLTENIYIDNVTWTYKEHNKQLKLKWNWIKLALSHVPTRFKCTATHLNPSTNNSTLSSLPNVYVSHIAIYERKFNWRRRKLNVFSNILT